MPGRFAAAAGSGRIAALDHKIFDDSVKDNAVVIAVFDVCGEILYGQGGDFRVELDLDATLGRLQNSDRVITL